MSLGEVWAPRRGAVATPGARSATPHGLGAGPRARKAKGIRTHKYEEL